MFVVFSQLRDPEILVDLYYEVGARLRISMMNVDVLMVVCCISLQRRRSY
jgi:hypothetical protein